MRYYWKLKYYLAKGQHYRHWQMRGNRKELEYFDPEVHSLTLHNCLLTNNIKIARKTLAGANRQPCAWVKCKTWSQGEPIKNLAGFEPLFYNPKVQENWQNEKGENIDQTEYKTVITINNRIFAKIQPQVIQPTLF